MGSKNTPLRLLSYIYGIKGLSQVARLRPLDQGSGSGRSLRTQLSHCRKCFPCRIPLKINHLQV